MSIHSFHAAQRNTIHTAPLHTPSGIQDRGYIHWPGVVILVASTTSLLGCLGLLMDCGTVSRTSRQLTCRPKQTPSREVLNATPVECWISPRHNVDRSWVSRFLLSISYHSVKEPLRHPCLHRSEETGAPKNDVTTDRSWSGQCSDLADG
jgi:hypothetical protein